MERVGQKWILDTMVAGQGFDAIFPDAYIGWLESGMKLQDYRRTMARVRSLEMLGKAWTITGDDLWQEAERAEARGRRATANELYHRAAFAYAKAFWQKKDTSSQRSLKETYAKVAATADYPIEQTEIPFGDTTVPAILHLPPNVSEPVPCVVFVPGMDMVKEEFPNVQNNIFVRRGIACLAIDGPGQGESLIRGLHVTLTNYQEACSAAADYIDAHPHLDAERVGIFGMSMGSYWAPSACAREPRFKGCVAALGCYLSKERIFKHAPPAFRHNYMTMSGISDDEEFDRMAEQMTLANYADKISCPVLLPHGEFDQLCTVDDALALFEMLRCPKELWIYEDEFHGIGRTRAEMLPQAADWLKDSITGRISQGHARILRIPVRP